MTTGAFVPPGFVTTGPAITFTNSNYTAGFTSSVSYQSGAVTDVGASAIGTSDLVYWEYFIDALGVVPITGRSQVAVHVGLGNTSAVDALYLTLLFSGTGAGTPLIGALSASASFGTRTYYNPPPGSVISAPPIKGQGHYVGIALDTASKKIWFTIDGVALGGGDPNLGTSPSISFTAYPGSTFLPYAFFIGGPFTGTDVCSSTVTINLGDRPLVNSYTGFRRLVPLAGANVAQRLLKPAGLIHAKAGGIPSAEYYGWMKDRKK